MFPREHGAYGQMAMPLIASFAAAGVSASGVLLALAVAAGFIAHEPLLVLLGRRGVRARRDTARRALSWLAGTGAVALVAGLASAWSMKPDVRWSLALPLLPAIGLGAAIVANRERDSLAQVAVALAFSLAAVPVCLGAGAPTSTGASVAAVFAAIFVAGTLAVRGIVLATRGGGNPRAARLIRRAVAFLAVAATAGLIAAGTYGLLPWAALVAAVPGLAVALFLSAFPPPPARLRTVGWTLVASSAAATLILVGFLARVR